ncbi:hypothetical protein QFC21_004550 [Naganishia friedmannii]|uniref:Uncharacterized protein n=1 Tax=Naganishia friedmannii TaxID=89922 RepID=A0ACC2VHD8_9TREE|nr:hypothetical protein QFC21_004550 [Naganishia friedmannii]
MPPINNITILGGGLTGLTVAYRLSRLIPTLPSLPALHPTHTGAHRDTKITLIEKSARIGGWVNSSSAVVRVPIAGISGVRGKGKGKEQQQNGDTIDVHITLEAGPRSIRPKGSAGAAYMLKLHPENPDPSRPPPAHQIKDLSLQPSILSVPLSHPSAKNRYILSRATNRLARLPSSLLDVLGFGGGGGGVGGGVSQQDNGIEAPAPGPGPGPAPGTDAREEKRLRKLIRRGIFRDLLRTRSACPAPPRTSSSPAGRDTTVHALVAATLGPEIANSLISAMVHGIYAADSRGVSVRSTFPVLWDAMYGTSGGVTGGVKRSGSLVWNLLVGSFFPGKKAPQTTEQRRVAAEEAAAWRELGELDEERKKWSVYGLKGGLGVLTDRMRAKVERSLVDVRTGCVVENIRVDERGMVQLTIHPSSADATQQPHETSLLISTLNPSTLHPLLTPTQPLPHLLANPSTSVGLVNLVYPLPSRSIHPDGFGYLVPRAPEDDGLPPPALPGTGTTTTTAASTPNPAGIIGVIFDSSTLPVDPTPHAAAHVTKLTVMLGGPYWRTREDVPQSTHLLEARARAHLEGVFPVLKGVEPLLAKAWIHRDCIPTYRPGHGARLRELHQVLSGSGSGGAGGGGGAGASAWAGKLVLAGSGYGGVGVNDCVGAAEGIVRAFERRWTRDSQAGGGAEEGEEVPVTGLERWKNWD